jgi:hypothetical protein
MGLYNMAEDRTELTDLACLAGQAEVLRCPRLLIDNMYTKVATVWIAEETAPTQIQKEFLSETLQ